MTLFDTGIRPIIDAHLLAEAAKVRDYGEYWSASSAGYCMRRNIFERLKVPHVVEDARKQRVFSSGHIFHEWIQGLTKAAQASEAQETELIDEELMIRGHFDDLVQVNGQYILYDYKTQNSKGFASYAHRPSHYHKMQLGSYCYMLNTLHDSLKLPKVTDARILKISKDDLRLAEIQYPYSEVIEKEVYKYWSTLNGYWKAKTMPPCSCADREGGFLAKEAYNGYFYEGEPCSIAWYEKWKAEREAVV